MKIKFLGTGASEGFPAPFCECEYCQNARKLGGKNLRTRTAAQIDDEVLIDFSTDVYAQTLFRGLKLVDINHILITHSHGDHYHPMELFQVSPPKAYYKRERKVHVYANAKAKSKFEYHVASLNETPNLEFHVINHYDKLELGNYQVVALEASHDPSESCFLYTLSSEGKSILYAHDTAVFSEKTWESLKPFQFDCVVLDCTMVEEKGHFEGHMGLEENIGIRNRMLEEGNATHDTVFIATHFAHMFNPAHDRITPIFAKAGFIAAYDGMEVEF